VTGRALVTGTEGGMIHCRHFPRFLVDWVLAILESRKSLQTGPETATGAPTAMPAGGSAAGSLGLLPMAYLYLYLSSVIFLKNIR
jgi:hypothetical protein